MEATDRHSPIGIDVFSRWHHWLKFRRDPLGFMAELRSEKKNEFVHVAIGPRQFFIAYHPHLARQILKDDADQYRKSRYIFDRMGPLIGKRALVRLEGERWVQNRKLTMQFFSPVRFDEFLNSVDWALECLFEELEEATKSGAAIDIAHWVTKVVLLAAGRILFQMDLTNSLEDLCEAFLQMNKLCGKAIRGVFSAPSFAPTPRHVGQLIALLHLHRAMKREFLNAKDPQKLEDHIVAFFRGNLEIRRNPNKTIGQMIAFLFPAFETTSTSLCWTMQLVAQHKWAQETIREEIGLKNHRPDVKDFGKWTFTEAVYKEALRLYPPAWILAREPVKDVQIDGRTILKGATVFLNVREIHRHPDFWTRPNAFRPERFLYGNEPCDPFAYIPFGAGPRICSGNNLGLAEGIWILASCLRRYSFELAGSPSSVEPWITSRPRSPIMVRVKRIG